MPNASVRVFEPDDLDAAGRILYRAFASGFRRHGYAEPLGHARAGVALATAALAADPGGGLVLELASRRPVGVGFFQRAIDGVFIGPIAIDPELQGMGHGKQLLDEVLLRAGDGSARLLQDAFNPVSYRLYARAGFAVRETLALFVTAPGGPRPGPFGTDGSEQGGVFSLRDLEPRDLDLITELDHRASGVNRRPILERVIGRMRGVVLDGPGGPRGFACAFPGAGVWVVGPGWSEEGRTLAAIVVGLAARCVQARDAVGLFAPASRADLIGPLLDVGFRVSHLVNVMVRGDFAPYRGACLPVLPVDTAPID